MDMSGVTSDGAVEVLSGPVLAPSDRGYDEQRVRIRSHKEDVPLETEGVTLWPEAAVPIQTTAR
jgi:hypothetical protein